MAEVLWTVLKGLGILIGATFVLSHISWWLLGKKYFPSKQVCYSVHWNYPGWFARERKFFKTHLAAVSVFGFLSTVLLAGIIPLNVSILAQIFSLFFPENEETLVLPIIGEYMVFPLLIGLLYALVELALSALRDYRKHLKQSYLAVSLTIGAMIFVEMGLNIYRSVIMAGDPTIARTFWDNFLGIGGPVLAGFLGFVVPLATVLLGAYAMMEFVMPMIQNVAVVLHTAAMYSLYGILVLLFGWHSGPLVKIPRQVRRLCDETADFKKQSDALLRLYQQILPSFSKMNKLAKEESLPLQEELDQLGKSIARMEEKTALRKPAHSGNHEATYYPNNIADKPELKQAIEETKDEIRAFQTGRDSSKSKIRAMSDQVVTFSENRKAYMAVWENCDAERNTLEQMLTSLEQGLQKFRIFDYCETIDAVLRHEPAASGILSKAECEDLLTQITASKNASRQKKEMARAAADLSLKITAESHADLVKIAKIAEDVRHWLEANPMPPVPDETNLNAHLDKLKRQLVDFNNRLSLVAKTMDARFDAMQYNLVTLAWQLAAYLIWIKLHASLRRSA